MDTIKSAYKVLKISPTTTQTQAVPQKGKETAGKIGTTRLAKPPLAGILRTRLGLTQPQFAPMLPVSVRSLAKFEHGVAPTEAVSRRLIELERLVAALSEVMKKEFVGNWLRTPNPAFAGLKPAEVIERGEADRLWELIYLLRSGIAY